MVIALRHVDEYGIGHGAHCVFATIVDNHKNVKSDLYTKLWGEVELAVTTADMIKDCGKKIIIHLDYNSNDKFYSNMIYNTGIGYATAMGYEVHGKPDGWVASFTSDKMCR